MSEPTSTPAAAAAASPLPEPAAPGKLPAPVKDSALPLASPAPTAPAAAPATLPASEPAAPADAIFRDHKGSIVVAPNLWGARIADTHCHLDMLECPELALARAAAQGVDFLVSVVDPSEHPETSYENLERWLAAAADLLKTAPFRPDDDTSGNDAPDGNEPDGNALLPPDQPGRDGNAPLAPGQPGAGGHALLPPEVHLMIGCHPHNASRYTAEAEARLRHYAADRRTVAIGEIGLDYHYDYSPRAVQQEVFARQIKLATELGLPIALHLRDAHDDGFAILERVGWPPAGCLLHCYTLGPEEFKPFVQRGCYVAFGGALTFKKADDIRAAAAAVPLERLVTETDAPYMAPQPLRGTTNGPEDIVFTAALLAELRQTGGLTRRAVLDRIYANARLFFMGSKSREGA